MLFTDLLFGATLPYEHVILLNESVKNEGDVLTMERMVRFPRCASMPTVANWLIRWMRASEWPGAVWLMLGIFDHEFHQGDWSVTDDSLSHSGECSWAASHSISSVHAQRLRFR